MSGHQLAVRSLLQPIALQDLVFTGLTEPPKGSCQACLNTCLGTHRQQQSSIGLTAVQHTMGATAAAMLGLKTGARRERRHVSIFGVHPACNNPPSAGQPDSTGGA